MNKPNILILGVLLLGGIAVLLLWQADHYFERSRIKIETRVTAEQVRLRLEACMRNRTALVTTLANSHWPDRAALDANWSDKAEILLRMSQGVQALNFIDNDWVVRIAYPAVSNRAILNRDLHDHSDASVPMQLSRSETSREIQRTPPIELIQSGQGFAFYQRVFAANGEPLGFVNGVFRISDLMNSCLFEEPLRDRFSFMLEEKNGVAVFQQAVIENESQDYMTTLRVNVPGSPWLLRFAPTNEYIGKSGNWLGEVVALLGLLLVGSLAVVVRSLQAKQKTLRESEDKYRILVENQSDMVVKLDADSHYLYVSPSYCRLLGEAEADLLGAVFERNASPGGRAPSSGGYFEQQVQTAGGPRWISWSETRVPGNAGHAESIIAVGRDVTELKLMEERMVHSQKMQAIGQMAGGITHDFNNMLHVMLGNIEFLIEATAGMTYVQEDLYRVMHGIERAMSLTEKLSTLSRQQAIDYRVISLNSFFAEITGLLVRTLPPSIKLTCHQSEEALAVLADPTQLEQVVLNICFNARDAVGANGAIEIDISKVLLDDDFCRFHPEIVAGWHAAVVISDNGSGIAPDILSQVFDPFFTTKPAGQGTGLGLANSYGIIKQHDGLLLVESLVDAGTAFTIYLPLTTKPVQAESQQQLRSGITVPVQTVTILLAEDDPAIMELTRKILMRAGYECLIAADGAAAISLFEANADKISLVILDLVMPVVDGRAAAERIKQVRPEVDILFVSGFIPANTGSAFEGLPGPLLSKPFKLEQLLDKVRSLLAV